MGSVKAALACRARSSLREERGGSRGLSLLGFWECALQHAALQSGVATVWAIPRWMSFRFRNRPTADCVPMPIVGQFTLCVLDLHGLNCTVIRISRVIRCCPHVLCNFKNVDPGQK